MTKALSKVAAAYAKATRLYDEGLEHTKNVRRHRHALAVAERRARRAYDAYTCAVRVHGTLKRKEGSEP